MSIANNTMSKTKTAKIHTINNEFLCLKSGSLYKHQHGLLSRYSTDTRLLEVVKTRPWPWRNNRVGAYSSIKPMIDERFYRFLTDSILSADFIVSLSSA